MFKQLLLTAIFSLGIVFPSFADINRKSTFTMSDTMLIRNHPGGEIPVIVREVLAFKKNGGKKVIVDGMCASACLFWIIKDFNLDVCVTPRAKIGFHVPYAVLKSNGALVYNEEVHNYNLSIAKTMYRGLPKSLQKYWAKEKLPDVYTGSRTDQLLWVKSPEIQKFFKVCKK